MGKRVKIVLAVVAVAVALVSVIGWQVVKPSAEPVYKGRTLTSWLEGYESGQANEADEAVRQIGTNALPTLLRLLRAKDSPLTLKPPPGWA